MSKPAYNDNERSWHVEDPELQSHSAVEERDLNKPRIPHLSPSRRRACVDYVMSELCISERRACRALGQHRSTQRKIATTPGDEVALTADIIELARQYGRYGYRRITALLRRAGWTVNKKRVERIWRSEGDRRIFCVRPVIRHAFTKRSLNMTANCVFASAHSRGGRFHSAAAWLRTKYSSLAAASSEGKCPLVRTA